MTRWWSRRWWPWHLLVLLAALAFVRLGLWQLERHQQLEQRNAALEARLEEAPRPYQALRPEVDPNAPLGAERDPRHRPVTARGSFAAEHEVLLRGRAHEGRPGHHVLTPLRLEEGGALLVNRGWVPYELDRPPIEEAAPPEGEVEVRGHLQPEDDPPTGFGSLLAPRDPPEGRLRQVAYADADRLERQMPYALEPYLLVAREITPGADRGLPRTLPAPMRDAGPHVGYALQWFSFAAIVLIGYPLLLRARARG